MSTTTAPGSWKLDKPDLPEIERAWLAAVLDCEGWIGMFRSLRSHGGYSYWPSVGVGNTNPILTDRLLKLTGVGTITFCQQKNPRSKLRYTWMAKSRAAVDYVLRQARPYLVLKHAQADLLLALPPRHTKAANLKYATHAKLAILNRKGVAV